ncbi:MAG: hypothetical protein OXG44_11465 [Gammaproteobacteria bacterium]|nr:hypothetical protein [Gammaproteobacteria bacterium]
MASGTEDDRDLTVFQTLQLLQMSRIADCGDGGGGVSGHWEIRSRDVLAILLIAARIMGWSLSGLPELAQRVTEEFRAGAAGF